MLFVFTLILGIIIGKAFGGKISNLLNFRFEKTWLLLGAFVLLTIARVAGVKFQLFDRYVLIINICVSIILLLGLWYNRHYAGIWFIGLGCICNTLVIGLNSGKMPVSAEVAQKVGVSLEVLAIDIKHVAFKAGDSVKMYFLSDIIGLPGILGYGMNVVSAGDLVIAVGVMLLAFRIVKNGAMSGRAQAE